MQICDVCYKKKDESLDFCSIQHKQAFFDKKKNEEKDKEDFEARKFHIVDIKDRDLNKESSFYTLIKDYPQHSIFIVTAQQKKRISTYTAGNTFFTDTPPFSFPVLAYEDDWPVYVVTEEESKKL